MKTTFLNSIDDPEIEPFLSMKSSKLLREDLILIESYKVIHKAIINKISIKKILTSESLLRKLSEEFILPQELESFLLPEESIGKLAGQSFHGGIMAICERPHRGIDFSKTEPILVLNGITSPENVGAIIRSASGFNIFNILFDKKTVHPLIKRAIRVSMGNVFFCNLHQTENLENTLKQLKGEGFEILSFANQESAKPLRHYPFKKKSILIIGSEGHGVDRNILELSNDVIKIKMNEEVMHFNAACASSIALYEFFNSI